MRELSINELDKVSGAGKDRGKGKYGGYSSEQYGYGGYGYNNGGYNCCYCYCCYSNGNAGGNVSEMTDENMSNNEAENIGT